MKTKRKSRAGLILALIVFFVAAGILVYYIGIPRITDYKTKQTQQGLNVLDEYYKNTDMIGWIQVEGTNISYPVMKGDGYLYRDFNKEYSSSGTPFVEDYWEEENIVTLIYAHNMWMYGTMFNPLHKFEDQDFFNKNAKIKFYAICGEETKYVEKRTFEITHVILTEVDTWNYSSCGLIQDEVERAEFTGECNERALFQRDNIGNDKLIALSTCSYHVKGKNGRLLVVGEIRDVKNQEHLDKKP